MEGRKLLSLIVSATLLCACSPKSKDDFMVSAQEAIDKGDYDTAIIQYKNAIALSPDDATSRYTLALTYLHNGNADSAEKELEKAIELGFDKDKILPELAEVYLQKGQYTAITLIKTNEISNPDSVIRVETLQGIAYLNLNNIQDAKAAFDKVLQINETAEVTKKYKALAEILYLTQENMQDAFRRLNTLVEQYPKWADGQLILGQIAALQKQPELAAKAFSQYQKLLPQNNLVKIHLAQAYLNSNQCEQAQTSVQELFKKYPNNPLLNQIMGLCNFEKNNDELAKLQLEKSIQAGINTPQNLLTAGISNYRLGNYEQAYDHLLATVDALPPNHPARKLLLAVELKLGYSQKAGALLNNISDFDPHDAGLILSATYDLLKNGEQTQALDNIELLDSLPIENSLDLAKRGIIKLQFNPESALIDLENALENAPENTEIFNSLGKAYLSLNKTDKASSLAKSWQKKYPNSAEPHNLMGLVYLSKNNQDEANSEFEKGLSKDPNNIIGLMHQTSSLYKNGDIQKARLSISNILDIYPTYIPAYQSAYIIFKSSNEAGKVITRLEKQNKLNPSATGVLLLASFYADQGNYTPIPKLLDTQELAKTLKNNSNYWQILSSAYFVLRQVDRSKNTIEQWKQAIPDSTAPWLTEINQLSKTNQHEQAIKILKQAKLKFADDNSLKMLEPLLLVNNNNIVEAKKNISALSDDLKNSPLVVLTLGKIYSIEGDFNKALPLLKNAYKVVPESETAANIFIAYKHLNQPSEAYKFLENHLNNRKNDVQNHMLIANDYVVNQPEKAIKHYEIVLSFNPQNMVALNNIAWCQMKTNQLDHARKNIESALEISSDSASLLDTAGQIYTALGNKEKAISLLEKALALSNNQASIQEHYQEAKAL